MPPPHPSARAFGSPSSWGTSSGSPTASMLAETAIARGRAERAAELLDAAEALRDAVGAPRTREDERRIGPCTAEARQVLGEVEFERVLARGRQLSRDDAVAVALDEADART
jgi:hypothetical protein